MRRGSMRINQLTRTLRSNGWRMLAFYAIPALPLALAYAFMGALAFHSGAELGWWAADYNTDAGEASVGFGIGVVIVLVALSIAVPIIACNTDRGMRLRDTATGVLLLVAALPLMVWGIGLALWLL
jgi:ABC-type spermidine/putrescine transport system permease subunit II